MKESLNIEAPRPTPLSGIVPRRRALEIIENCCLYNAVNSEPPNYSLDFVIGSAKWVKRNTKFFYGEDCVFFEIDVLYNGFRSGIIIDCFNPPIDNGEGVVCRVLSNIGIYEVDIFNFISKFTPIDTKFFRQEELLNGKI